MLLTQKHLTVVATVNFHARIKEYEVSASQLCHANQNHQWLDGIQQFANINILQSSVAAHQRWGEIFINNFIANLQLSTSVKELWKSVNI